MVLSTTALAEALKRGGLVLYMRHAETGVISAQCEKSNLTPPGEAAAARVGSAMRAMKIPIGAIFTSDVCRARDTARLLGVDAIGAVEVTEDLTNTPKRESHDIHAARMKRLATPPPAGAHTLLVSHMHTNTTDAQAVSLDFGEIIVFQPNGQGGADAVARIRVDDWARLAKAAKVAWP